MRICTPFPLFTAEWLLLFFFDHIFFSRWLTYVHLPHKQTFILPFLVCVSLLHFPCSRLSGFLCFFLCDYLFFYSGSLYSFNTRTNLISSLSGVRICTPLPLFTVECLLAILSLVLSFFFHNRPN